jgi:hypothetical protein
MKAARLKFAVAVSIALAAAFAAAQPQRPVGEMIQNGDFESELAGWSHVAEGGAKGSVSRVTDNALGEFGPHSLRLEATELGQRCGVANAGPPGGMNVTSGQWYDVTFHARGEGGRGIGLVFSLESADGKKVCARTTLPEIGRSGIGRPVEGNGEWSQYTVSLRAHASEPKCRLVISPIEPATLQFDGISLVPRRSSAAAGEAAGPRRTQP